MEETCFVPYFIPGRCYRRGDQLMRVIGPLFPTVLPLTELALWREITEEEWDVTLVRVKAHAERRQPLAATR
jgi:hypothetical protein